MHNLGDYGDLKNFSIVADQIGLIYTPLSRLQLYEDDFSM